jgi:hypothetical protein
MIQRSPTYVIPITYWRPEGLGMYDRLPAEVADSLIFSAPVAVGGQMLGLIHAKFAAQEPWVLFFFIRCRCSSLKTL